MSSLITVIKTKNITPDKALQHIQEFIEREDFISNVPSEVAVQLQTVKTSLEETNLNDIKAEYFPVEN